MWVFFVTLALAREAHKAPLKYTFRGTQQSASLAQTKAHAEAKALSKSTREIGVDTSGFQDIATNFDITRDPEDLDNDMLFTYSFKMNGTEVFHVTYPYLPPKTCEWFDKVPADVPVTGYGAFASLAIFAGNILVSLLFFKKRVKIPHAWMWDDLIPCLYLLVFFVAAWGMIIRHSMGWFNTHERWLIVASVFMQWVQVVWHNSTIDDPVNFGRNIGSIQFWLRLGFLYFVVGMAHTNADKLSFTRYGWFLTLPLLLYDVDAHAVRFKRKPYPIDISVVKMQTCWGCTFMIFRLLLKTMEEYDVDEGLCDSYLTDVKTGIRVLCCAGMLTMFTWVYLQVYCKWDKGADPWPPQKPAAEKLAEDELRKWEDASTLEEFCANKMCSSVSSSCSFAGHCCTSNESKSSKSAPSASTSCIGKVSSVCCTVLDQEKQIPGIDKLVLSDDDDMDPASKKSLKKKSRKNLTGGFILPLDEVDPSGRQMTFDEKSMKWRAKHPDLAKKAQLKYDDGYKDTTPHKGHLVDDSPAQAAVDLKKEENAANAALQLFDAGQIGQKRHDERQREQDEASENGVTIT